MPVGGATAVVPGETTLTVAVKVVDWPKRVGLTADVCAVVVSALETVWVKVPLVGLKLPSLVSLAVMVWLRTPTRERVMVGEGKGLDGGRVLITKREEQAWKWNVAVR